MTTGPAFPDDAGQADTAYEQEVEAEQTGRTAEAVNEERSEEKRDPLDEAYQPRSG